MHWRGAQGEFLVHEKDHKYESELRPFLLGAEKSSESAKGVGTFGPFQPLISGLDRCVAARETGLSPRVRNQMTGEFTQPGWRANSLRLRQSPPLPNCGRQKNNALGRHIFKVADPGDLSSGS